MGNTSDSDDRKEELSIGKMCIATFFTEELKAVGKTFNTELEIVCEEFEAVNV
ncbi:MAG: hypothetical protein K6E85_16335 [Lachnospiraceae bacterium]|nr:hypothetical protein [Lachnospiraceae bacterium]